jgi:hypothetical protein
MARFAIQQPSAIAGGHEDDEEDVKLTTLRAAVKTIPEVKVLTEERQEFTVAIELEGVLHNRNPLPDTSLDVIFLIDNGYVSHHRDGQSCSVAHIERKDTMYPMNV